jgi:PAS fold
VSEVDPLDLVETIREGLLVLDPDLTVRFANRSFCDAFAVTPEDTVGLKLYELGNGQWDIPELRALIETIVPERVGGYAPGLSPMCPPQQRGELGDVRRESMPSSLCALANKFEHLTSFELFVFTFRERQIPRIAGNAIDAAHDADVTGGCTFHAE